MNLIFTFLLVFTGIQDDGKELIAAFQALPEGASGKKIEILDKLARLDSDEADRFIFKVMDQPGETPVRARAFHLWAQRRFPEVIRDYLDEKKSSSVFRIFIPVIPRLIGFDGLGYLKGVYEDSALTRFRKEATVAIAAFDNQEAFAYLLGKWEVCGSFDEAFDLLPSLLSMKGARDQAFLLHLLQSSYPFARYEGAVRLLRPGPTFSIERVAEHLEKEANHLVRKKILEAAAGLGTSDAALLILQASRSHPESEAHEIVEILASLPAAVLHQSLPADWFLSRWPVVFQPAALALSLSGEFAGSITREEMEMLKDALRDPDPGVRIVAATAIDRLMSGSFSVKAQLKALIGGGSTETQWEVLDTIQRFRLGDPNIVERLLSLLNSQKLEIRIKAAEVLSVLGIEDALPQMEKWLANKLLPLRVAAIKALGRLGGVESVVILMNRLPRESGRAQWEIVHALKKITGRNFGSDSALWHRWWEQSEGVLPPPAVKNSLWYPEKEAEPRYAFYGLPIDSHNIMYVLDVSGSMEGAKIARLREELTRALKSYTGDYSVNMIFFNESVEKWKKELEAMGDSRSGRRAQALLRIRYLQAAGGTNLHGALMEALEDPEVESIILLSDGDPTVGDIVDKEEILDAVRNRNRINQTRIHVIAIGASDRSFMRRLAETSGGTFKSVD